MKVLHIITNLLTGGAEKIMVDLLPRFKQDGIEVDLLLLNGTDSSFKRQLESMGIRIFELGHGSVYNPLHILRIIPYLKKYDIVHTHNFAAQLFAAIGSMLCSVTLVTTEHNTTNRRRDWWWYHPIERWMYDRYSKIICISDQAEINLQKHLSNNHNICTIYNGVDTQAFFTASPSSEIINRFGNYKKLIMVSRFAPAKDQKTVIRAMTLLPQDYHLFLVGEGNSRIDCQSMANELGVDSRVHFMGNRSDIPQLINSADVAILSSHWEGMPLSAIEAMATRRPLVASNVDGIYETVFDAGILFEHENANDLASKIISLFADKLLYNEVAEKCYRRALKYDISNMAKAYEECYNTLRK